MTRVRRTLTILAVLAALIAGALAAVVITLRTDWFREQVRRRIIAELTRATNGRVETGPFRFDWQTLTAELDNLTVHGTEPAGQPPLLAVKRVSVSLKIISLFERTFDLAKAEMIEPKIHLILSADGTNNIPPPHNFKPQAVIDLKVRYFNMKNGLLSFETPEHGPTLIPLRARGENLAAESHFMGQTSSYEGSVSMNPVHLDIAGYSPVETNVDAAFTFARNLITIPYLTAKSGDSEIRLHDVNITDLNSPVITAGYHGRVSLNEADRILKLTNFQHTGTMDIAGRLRYTSAGGYESTGAAYGFGISYGKLTNLSAVANFTASPDSIRLTGMLAKALDGEVRGDGEIAGWDRFRMSGTFEGFAANRAAEVAGMTAFPWDGMLAGTFRSTGTLSEKLMHSLKVEAQILVSPAPAPKVPVHGELAVTYDAISGNTDFAPSWLAVPQSRADFDGRPGTRIHINLASGNLNELRPAIVFPDAFRGGSATLTGTVDGSPATLRLEGHADGHGLVWGDETFDSLTGDFSASADNLTLRTTSISWHGASLHGNALLGLKDWKGVDSSSLTADVQLSNGEINKLAALAGQPDLPLSGTLGLQARLTGTLGDPHTVADLAVSNGHIYGEPFDSATGHAQYKAGSTQTLAAVVLGGSKRLTMSATFEHAPGSALAGKLTFTAAGTNLALNQFALLKQRQPDIRGAVTIKAEGTGELANGQLHLSLLNAEASASALGIGARNLGTAHASAATSGETVKVSFDSNAANANIRGQGTVTLNKEYPVTAQITFSDVTLDAVEAVMYPRPAAKGSSLEGELAGDVTISGPLSNPDLLTAAVNLRTLALRPGSQSKPAAFAIRNEGPVRLSWAGGALRVQNADFVGPRTKLQVAGTVSPREAAPLDLRVTGTVGLDLIHSFSEELTATGELNLNSAVRGTFEQPDLSGRADLRGGEFHYAGLANAFTNANGVFIFSGNRATIQNLSAETGGGKLGISGFAALTDGVVGFRLEAKGRQIRIRYPEGVSTLSDSDITLTGTPERSQAAGRVVIRRVAVNPRSDAASLLARSLDPLRTPAARTGAAANLNLDIQIETAPDVAFETSVAQSLQADASLRIRGTATSPALLGRVNITQGEMVVFGNKYTINQGSVSFFNPAKIDPILNVDLETRSRGVDVVLTISGPVSKLNVGYRSDPPLQFGDIVALLATGRTPGNTTVAGSSGGAQAFQQLGASALVGQAISAPAPGRLERFFGVARIKIDPQLTGLTGTPEARLTVEQQVTPNLLFTYVSDVTNTNSQLIRVEWDFDRTWGAILTREANGYVGLDFAYKKRFK